MRSTLSILTVALLVGPAHVRAQERGAAHAAPAKPAAVGEQKPAEAKGHKDAMPVGKVGAEPKAGGKPDGKPGTDLASAVERIRRSMAEASAPGATGRAGSSASPPLHGAEPREPSRGAPAPPPVRLVWRVQLMWPDELTQPPGPKTEGPR